MPLPSYNQLSLHSIFGSSTTSSSCQLRKNLKINDMSSLLASPVPIKVPSDGYSNLCQTCTSMFQGERKDKPLGVTATQPLNQTLQELESSAENGCHLCYIRWHDLSPAERLALTGCEKVTFGFWKSRVGDGIAFEYFYAQLQVQPKPCLTKSVMLKPVDGMRY